MVSKNILCTHCTCGEREWVAQKFTCACKLEGGPKIALNCVPTLSKKTLHGNINPFLSKVFFNTSSNHQKTLKFSDDLKGY